MLVKPVTHRHGITPHKDIAGMDELVIRTKAQGGFSMRMSLVVTAAALSSIAQAASAAQLTSRLANGTTLLLAGPPAGVRVLSVWRARYTRRRVMAQLDDHLLHDIGLKRADVERESAKPFWRP